MAQACPINFTTIDNTASRIGSAVTAAVLTLFVITANPVWMFWLAADLLIRLHGNRQYSLVFQLSKQIKQLLRLPASPVDGAAKHVAGHFGLLFAVTLFIAAYFQMSIAVYVIAGIFGLCLLMDVAVNFCVGCKVYYLYRMLTIGGR